ncbi:MAG: GNAT family N-acetyltransferase [Pseudomonadota bacterium]
MTPPRPIPMSDLSAPVRDDLLALNNAHAVETSELTAAEWDSMQAEAFAALAIGNAGFVLAFDQTAQYSSTNFQWFQNRFERFVYVDRIVVSAQSRGQGVARMLYQALFALARDAAHPRVVCEVNQTPPNPGSDAFHAALGFRPLETRALSPTKTVQYLECPI